MYCAIGRIAKILFVWVTESEYNVFGWIDMCLFSDSSWLGFRYNYIFRSTLWGFLYEKLCMQLPIEKSLTKNDQQQQQQRNLFHLIFDSLQWYLLVN